MSRFLQPLAIIGPGLLVAATGVGAGDLATGAFCGSLLGVGVLWAVLLGAAFKLALTEGLTHWQLATGSTLLEGVAARFGRVVGWILLGYLLLWSYFVGAALMGACGVTAHAIAPLMDATSDKVLYGIGHSVAALVLVRLAGFKVFERLMAASIVVMFAVVVCTAIVLRPDWSDVVRGLVVPSIPRVDASATGEDGLRWTVALIGGVGGTVTILCYGYWIREVGRDGVSALRVCRLDLASGYAVTALFGVAMVVIGSRIETEASGAGLVVKLGEQLRDELGPIGGVARWAFLIGAWSAVFSSLLGVWQSVPYLFADLWRLVGPRGAADVTAPLARRRSYLVYQIALASVPAIGLLTSFREAQQLYAIVGAMFLPMLALALLILNARRNGVVATLALLATLGFFAFAAWRELS